MKKLIVSILVGLLMMVNGFADENNFRIVGETPSYEYICEYTLEQGQKIYVVSLEKEPHLIKEDVNFDGHEDVVITTIMGASNFFTEFFIWQDGQYVPVQGYPMDEGLCNYQLFPEEKMLLSSVDNGSAGALHEEHLLKWNGTRLKLVRKAVSEEKCDMVFENDRFIQTTYMEKYRFRVFDYSLNPSEETVLWDKEFDSQEITADILEKEYEILWQDLK